MIVGPVRAGLDDVAPKANQAATRYATNCSIVDDPAARAQCENNANLFAQLSASVRGAGIEAQRIGRRSARGGSRKRKRNARSMKSK